MDNYEISEAMIFHGGSFVKQLGLLFRLADEDNKRRLLLAFPEYWKQYRDVAIQLARQRGEIE